MNEDVHRKINDVHPYVALARVVCLLRPGWDPAQVYAALVDDPRAPAVAVPAAVAAATDPAVHLPRGIRTYAPDLVPRSRSWQPPPVAHVATPRPGLPDAQVAARAAAARAALHPRRTTP